jgi:hypothetical protein
VPSPIPPSTPSWLDLSLVLNTWHVSCLYYWGNTRSWIISYMSYPVTNNRSQDGRHRWRRKGEGMLHFWKGA